MHSLLICGVLILNASFFFASKEVDVASSHLVSCLASILSTSALVSSLASMLAKSARTSTKLLYQYIVVLFFPIPKLASILHNKNFKLAQLV